MIIIKDRCENTSRLKLLELLQTILLNTNLKSVSQLRLTRFGGVGKAVWEVETSLESKLELGENFSIIVEDLIKLAADTTQEIDELQCHWKDIYFGLSDACFLFFQSDKLNLETKIAKEFRQVQFIENKNFM